MSINWVMLKSPEEFVHLQDEKIIYSSPPRTSLSLQNATLPTGNVEVFNRQSGGGCIHLTNQRIVYLPAHPTPELKSFSAPLLNIQDSHVSAPFFGPNVWTALVQPVRRGGIPASLSVARLKLTFKDGGAYDFAAKFEMIKERLHAVWETHRENRRGQSHTSSLGLDYATVHLEDLPAYEESSGSDVGAASWRISALATAGESSAAGGLSARPGGDLPEQPNRAPSSLQPPTEPPPGYEAVQVQRVEEELEELQSREQ